MNIYSRITKMVGFPNQPFRIIPGGFQPREPDTFYHKYVSTKYPIDITTGKPSSSTVDPDTIHITTETPPQFNALLDSSIRQADDEVDKSPMPNFDITRDPENDGFLGDLFGMLFKDDGHEPKTSAEVEFKTKLESSKEHFSHADIPPFRTIGSGFVARNPEDTRITTTTTPTMTTTRIPERDAAGNGTAIKNILLDLLGKDSSGGSGYGTRKTQTINSSSSDSSTTSTTQRTSTSEPMFPVHVNPYLLSSTINHINPRPIDPVRNNLDFLLADLNKVNHGHHHSNNNNNKDRNSNSNNYHIVSDDLNRLVAAGDSPYVVNPVDLDQLKRHQSEQPAQILTKPAQAVTMKNDLGLLISGCNIYGRMYRVGRIISELSGPCLECKCTEVGVHCTTLGCAAR